VTAARVHRGGVLGTAARVHRGGVLGTAARVHRAVAVAAAAALLVATAGVGALFAAERYLHAPVAGDGVLTVLLLGADAGPPRGGSPRSARADGFHLLVVAPDRRRATFVNFPRDSYLPVPGHGRTKLNACLVSGPDTCAAAIRDNYGIEVDLYLLTSMQGLIEGVDQFGGVTVDVPRQLYDGGEDILETGRQRLQGARALTFARDRKHRPGGDFTRTEAQATLLQAAHRKLVEDGPSVARIAQVVGIVQRTTVTDADADQLLRLGYLAATIPPGNVANVTLPGRAGTAGGASVVFLGDRADRIVADAADDGVVGTGG
jgi:LCP family protein required for cell wall assembly